MPGGRPPKLRTPAARPPPKGAKWISLTRGKYALVDKADFDRTNAHNWSYSGNGYALNHSGAIGRPIYLHQYIVGQRFVDHINGDPLDNRRKNLRVANQSKNLANQKLAKHNTSGFKGVTYDRGRKKFKAQIMVKQKNIFLGRRSTAVEAAHLYDDAARRHFGQHACLNFPGTGERRD